MLKSEVRYFNLTPEEYQQLLLAKESTEAGKSTKDVVQNFSGRNARRNSSAWAVRFIRMRGPERRRKGFVGARGSSGQAGE